jgi:hypothetical protein
MIKLWKRRRKNIPRRNSQRNKVLRKKNKGGTRGAGKGVGDGGRIVSFLPFIPAELLRCAR